MKKLTTFAMLFLVWVLLVWPFAVEEGDLLVGLQDIVAGLLVALLGVIVLGEMQPADYPAPLNPLRLVWFVGYALVLAYNIVVANLDVAYRILHPALPINPGIVKVKTELKSAAAITLLSNSITLTPGTLTVNAAEEGVLYIHWINVGSTDIEEATERIVKRFEWLLKRMYER